MERLDSETIGENFNFSLVGCTVASEFDFADFEMATKESLLEKFPQQKTFSEQYCLS